MPLRRHARRLFHGNVEPSLPGAMAWVEPRLASDDYPELTEILVERPPLEGVSKVASWRDQQVEVRGEAKPLDRIVGGKWYHGTGATLRAGDRLSPGHGANFSESPPDVVSITSEYSTALYWAKQVAPNDPKVYEVEPVGDVDVWRVTLGDYGKGIVVLEGRVSSAVVLGLAAQGSKVAALDVEAAVGQPVDAKTFRAMADKYIASPVYRREPWFNGWIDRNGMITPVLAHYELGEDAWDNGYVRVYMQRGSIGFEIRYQMSDSQRRALKECSEGLSIVFVDASVVPNDDLWDPEEPNRGWVLSESYDSIGKAILEADSFISKNSALAADTVVLWRGVSDYGGNAGVWEGGAHVGHRDFETAEELLAYMREDRENYGRWWGSESDAKFYAGGYTGANGDHSGVVIAARFPAGLPADGDYTGAVIPSGTVAQVERVEVWSEDGWRVLPHRSGLTITAASDAGRVWRGIAIRGLGDEYLAAQRSGDWKKFAKRAISAIADREGSEWQMTRTQGGIGNSWTFHVDTAKKFAGGNGLYVRDFDALIPIVIEADYESQGVVRDPERDGHAFGYDGREEYEVVMTDGAPLVLAKMLIAVSPNKVRRNASTVYPIADWVEVDLGQIVSTAGIRDWLLNKGKEWADSSGTPADRAWTYDWCRFRRNSHCYYPKHLNKKASKEAGYAVWVPVDRGVCPRDRWEDQKACPAPSEPGPKSGEREYGPDATVAWEDGGQRRASATPLTIRSASLWPDEADSIWGVCAEGHVSSPRPLCSHELVADSLTYEEALVLARGLGASSSEPEPESEPEFDPTDPVGSYQRIMRWHERHGALRSEAGIRDFSEPGSQSIPSGATRCWTRVGLMANQGVTADTIAREGLRIDKATPYRDQFGEFRAIWATTGAPPKEQIKNTAVLVEFWWKFDDRPGDNQTVSIGEDVPPSHFLTVYEPWMGYVLDLRASGYTPADLEGEKAWMFDGENHDLPEQWDKAVAYWRKHGSAGDGDWGFHVQATWRDVQAKAKTIRENNHVRILAVTGTYITGEVKGDNGVYRCTIMRTPGSKSTAMWECGCFLPDAPVLMADGTEKPISEVHEGEYVFSHEGRVQQVKKAWGRPWDDDLVTLKVAGDQRSITATHDHPIWVADAKWALGHSSVDPQTRYSHLGTTIPSSGSVGWREAGAIEVGDYVSFAPPEDEEPLLLTYQRPRQRPDGESGSHSVHAFRPPAGKGRPKWVAHVWDRSGKRYRILDRFPFTDEGRIQAESVVQAWFAQNDSSDIKVDAELAWLFGLYLAEGFISRGSVGFALGAHELDLATRVQDICERHFGSRGSVRIVGSSLDLRISHWLLVAMCTDLVGHGVASKTIDARLMRLPLELQRAFIEGVDVGDGSTPSPGTHNHAAKRHEIALANEGAIRGLKMMLARLGVRSSVSFRSKNPGGLPSTKNGGPIWRVSWTEHEKWSSRQFWRDGRMWYKVLATERYHHRGEVWDLEVEGDHSFVAYGVGVHNCSWSNYAWGRSGRWKRYEGRMCSHALALTWEAQSREMFGKTLNEDREAPEWSRGVNVAVPGQWGGKAFARKAESITELRHSAQWNEQWEIAPATMGVES